MRLVAAAALALTMTAIVVPGARAQNLNDIGRSLQDQLLGGRPNPDAERRAYEQGRADQENARRQAYEDNRRREGRHDRFEDAQRHQRDLDRQQADQRRAWADEERARTQSRRY